MTARLLALLAALAAGLVLAAPGRAETLPLPPLETPPPQTHPGALSEADLVPVPETAPPSFDGAVPTTADVCVEGCRFRTLVEAANKTGPGATVTIAPGLYPECLQVREDMRIIGLKGPNGERAEITGACAGKGAFVVATPRFEARGIAIRGITVPDGNGACFRLGSTVEAMRLFDVVCADSDTAVLGGGPDLALFVDSSLIVGAGRDGQAHGLYVTAARELVLRNTVIHSGKGAGHTLKSAARRTLVLDSILAGLDGHTSRAIDLYGGGTLVVRGSVLQSGPQADNNEMIHLMGEPGRMPKGARHIVLIEDSVLLYDDPARCCRRVVTGTALGPVILRDSLLVGLTDIGMGGVAADALRRADDRAAAGLSAYDGTLGSLPRPEAWSKGG